MKIFLSFITLVVSFSASTATINLEPVDQQKIAVLLGELPRAIRTRSIVKVETPAPGMKVKNVFLAGPLSFECESLYYGRSLYATDGKCTLSITMSDPSVMRQNSEIRVDVKDPKIVTGLYHTIPYGKPVKSLWGWERDQGINFDGYRSPLFHFRVSCTEKLCSFYFSSFRLVQ